MELHVTHGRGEDGLPDRATGIVAELQKLLAQCPDINVEDADVVSEMDFTMYEIRNMVKWDFDFLSPEESATESGI